jgi:hypothetical protein
MNKLTPEMLLAMDNVQKEKVKSMIIELNNRTQYLTKKDIGSWRKAWQMAIRVEHPNRAALYDVYTDVDIDLHLTGAIGQRKGFVQRKSFKIVSKKDKKELPDITELFESEWFKNFMSLALDSRYWGHSLIQFGDIVTIDDKRQFQNVSLVPRKHVIPEYGVIVREIGDLPNRGFDYRSGDLARWCIEAGAPDDLGLFLKLAPQALSKKNMLAFWDAFGEMFGMPIRIGKTTSRDPKEITKVEKMLEEMGAAAWGMFPEGTEIEIVETTRGDAYNVYDKRIDRANSEMAKGVLNATMTLDNGSSRSQSEVHLEILKNVIETDADFIRDLVNNRLIPFMVMHGFPVKDCRLDWDESIDYTPDEQRQIEDMLLKNGYEIDPNYFAEKYNIKITGKKVPALPTPPNKGKSTADGLDKTKLNFFA